MEGSYYYYSDGEEQSYAFNYGTSDFYNEQASIEVWSDPDYDEGSYEDSSPQQPVWGCCACEESSSTDEEQSLPGCPCQNSSPTGSDEVSSHSVSESRTSSDWETDDGNSSVASEESGKSHSGSTVHTDSCRTSESSSSWETASTEESESSWETATTCSCEAASTTCLSCGMAEDSPKWDDEPPADPNCAPAKEWMSHPFSEGGGGSGSLVPLPPSASLPRALPRLSPHFLRWKKMNSSGVGRRQERRKVTKQKQARGPCTIQKGISAPTANPTTAQKASPAQVNHKSTRPRRRRFRWNPVQKKKRKAATTDAVKIGDGVAGPSGKNQRRLRTAS